MINILKKIFYLGHIKKSYSQDHEDLYLINYFKNKKKGFYIDLGCHHPKRFSNTYLLYKKGWNGLNIDANRWTIILFKLIRPRDHNIKAIISTTSDLVTFYEFDESALSGILSPERLIELEELGYKFKRKKLKKPITISSIINKYKLSNKQIDFLKIDLEGLDFEILRNLNLMNLNIELLMIEKSNDKENREIIKFLSQHLFQLIFETKRNFILKKITL